MAAEDHLAGLGSNPMQNLDFSNVMKTVRAMSERHVPQLAISTPVETASFESARALVKGLSARIKAWKSILPKPFTPAVFAVLPNGMTIDVSSLSAEGHHGLVILGNVNEKPVMITIH